MMKTYSLDLRERVVRACDEGKGTHPQIADLFGVSTAWIRRLLQRRRATGSLVARPRGGSQPRKMDNDRCFHLLVLVHAQPDATLAELHQRLDAPVHLTTIHRTLVGMGWTVKKKVQRAAEQDRPDVQHKRAIWRGRTARIDPDRFVFLDETGAHTVMTRLIGRAPVGERLVCNVPQAHWQTTTLLGAIRRSGVVATLTLEGATDAMAFQTYIEQVLVPQLRPGDIVVMDRLQAHRGRAVARALRKAGVGVWFLPPYSPDYNPIEKIWAKIKAILRKAEARTTETLWDAIGQALAQVTAQDCQNCFAHCGYRATIECKML
jgi:transposase